MFSGVYIYIQETVRTHNKAVPPTNKNIHWRLKLHRLRRFDGGLSPNEGGKYSHLQPAVKLQMVIRRRQKMLNDYDGNWPFLPDQRHTPLAGQ